MFLIALILSVYLNRAIYNPVKKLAKRIEKIQHSDFSQDDTLNTKDEFGIIGRGINKLSCEVTDLMDRRVEDERKKLELEYRMLSSQINPHFLYNTLDSVIWMTESGRYEEAIQMVTSLARFFRISLSRGNGFIPIRDELEHARHYMTIQQIRFKNRFTSEITADEDVQQLYTVKLIVQPLLENAIYHGMSEAEDDGKIRVHAYRHGSEVWIDVEDNGLGMRPEVAEQLLSRSRPAVTGSGSGIGVINVHQRIQLSFGKQYGLTIESEPDEGTRVRIRIPALDEVSIKPYRKEESQ